MRAPPPRHRRRVPASLPPPDGRELRDGHCDCLSFRTISEFRTHCFQTMFSSDSKSFGDGLQGVEQGAGRQVLLTGTSPLPKPGRCCRRLGSRPWRVLGRSPLAPWADPRLFTPFSSRGLSCRRPRSVRVHLARGEQASLLRSAAFCRVHVALGSPPPAMPESESESPASRPGAGSVRAAAGPTAAQGTGQQSGRRRVPSRTVQRGCAGVPQTV